ncbi:hypothetical protein DFH05DRAFT_1486007 [Lentinula detonsa]|uniref:Uncharacterized protein n=1 Tax=Lentinula detonsa TaxID=2804962 RepID=A0A9W8TZS4_9AGAR|nr:hypothetical protein DFH05DRAFT_1486007 [Lentinula detonsa]
MSYLYLRCIIAACASRTCISTAISCCFEAEGVLDILSPVSVMLSSSLESMCPALDRCEECGRVITHTTPYRLQRKSVNGEFQKRTRDV